jgi:hypothetical protein
MKTQTMNMFAATNEDLPIISGFALTQAAEMPQTVSIPYRIWLDSVAGYARMHFSTLEAAIEAAEQFRSPFHLQRIELDGNCIAITLPTYYWEK